MCAIISGEYPTGNAIPSVRQLARVTIENYFREMKTLGFTKDEALSIITNREGE